MVKLILNIIYNLNYKIMLRKIILFESNPDYCDNTKKVFDKLIDLKINKKYKIIWFVDESRDFRDINIENVYFLSRYKSLFCKIRFVYYNLFSKYIIDCNKVIRKLNKYQFRIHLTHGTPLKLAKDYCKLVGKFDYIIDISNYFDNITSELFKVGKEKVITTGFPRNDDLFNKENSINCFSNIERNKTILWMPTYRNHKAKDNSNKKYFPFGIPVIYNDKDLNTLNCILSKNKILLVIHLHPAEDIKKIMSIELSNIRIINQTFFGKNHSNLYQLLPNIDAIITDYSSIYYDYLLLDRPIGLAIPDIEDYKKNTSLLFDDYEKNIAGEYIYNFDDLNKFINNIAKNIDSSYKNRLEKKKKYHKYFDNNSSYRVANILIDKMKEDNKK